MNMKELQTLPFRVYGDLTFRGKCPKEDLEQITFFNRLRSQYPETYGRLAIHPRNEASLRGGQFTTVAKMKAEGMTPGASDIIIPGGPSFVCEMKRRDPTQSQWQDGQISYLTAAHNLGAFTCVAFGCDAAWSALQDYLGSL